uniref:Otogelin like n=1 Tax=Gorilla gorilla gorilla TaxID=9595 RepID=G3RGH6_GORGO
MIPWSIFLLHVLLFSLQEYICASSILMGTSKNGFNENRQKRALLAAQFEATSPRYFFHDAINWGESKIKGSCPYECLNGAFCSKTGTCDCQIFQALGTRCQIIPNMGNGRDGICKTWGQYHFETFDGIYYYFPGNCSYIFAKDCGDLEPRYTVWVHNSPKCLGSVYSCYRSISLFFSNQEEIRIYGHEIKKNGISLTLPQTIGQIFIEKLADYILVKTTFGFSLAWDGISGIYLKLSEDHKGKSCGLCGNYNDIQSDDFIILQEDYTEDIAMFANSWSVQTPDDTKCVLTPSDFPNPCSSGMPAFEAIFFKCQILLQFPFLSCHEYIDPYLYIASCVNDLCKTDDDETYCRAATEYARACSHAGYPIQDWRDDFPACTDRCDDSFVHRDCISCCPPTCTFEKQCLGSNLHCLDGCYCPDNKLSGLCGNFDKCTSNDMTTSNNLEVRNAQVFGDSWALGQCESPDETIKPCEAHQNKFPYAKKECSILYSDIFASCRNVIDVTSFAKNCHEDTCNCNLGGDCECLCTSIAAYAYKCCQEGISIHWRSSTVCSLDCEYYNEGLGEGPYMLASYGQSGLVLGANMTSRSVFCLPRSSVHTNLFFYFMITPGLFKEKVSSLALVSLESAERPNYFLYVHDNDTLSLELWEANSAFHRRATFFHHQGLWIPGYSAFELHSKKGFFIIFTDSSVKASKYDDSEEFKHSSSFSIEEIQAAVPYRKMCEWRYEPCATPCFKTCSDPEALACKFLPPVEGCLPYCPKNMILDEVTLKCVYPGDCIPVIPTEPTLMPPAKPTVPMFTVWEMITPSDITVFDMLTPTTGLECEPQKFDPVYDCSQYICLNMEWQLYNWSLNCPKDVEMPDCGFRGRPVQVNSDICCPEWECPCRCSMLSELSIITFDGNNAALYSMASYILVRIPGEIIVAHIEKCSMNQNGNSLKKLAPSGRISGLCFKKLNVTTPIHKIIVNRLARKVEVDSIVVPLPFSSQELSVEDSGSMYVITTPAGLIIKWSHLTGIIDIHFGFRFNLSSYTEGLCGICNEDPDDDLRMQNGTIITNMEDIGLFIESWEIEKSFEVTMRRPVRNCTKHDCSQCIDLLNRRIFIPCHDKVSPEDFCEKMWINYTYFWNYECDALSAYVALCNKFDICIQWRTPDYCSLSCPEGKEYQPCVRPCEARTCLNQWFYGHTSCLNLREDCVCKDGTILHRPHSTQCIPEKECACTDSEDQPRTAGEIWNGGIDECALYKCLENGSIIPIEPDCDEEPMPVCEREAEVVMGIIDKWTCCSKEVCGCDTTLCETTIPTCTNSQKLIVGHSPLSCCPQYKCECDPLKCPSISTPECREDQFMIQVQQEEPCCFSPFCVCESCTKPVPLCHDGEFLTVDLNSTHFCCPQYYCVCEPNLCPMPLLNCAEDMNLVKENVSGQCCPTWHCECNCENLVMPTCEVGEFTAIDRNFQSDCGCIQYLCEKDDVCVFQEVSVLNPGQSMIKYLEEDFCYTIECLEEKDNHTGFHTLNFTLVNCSKKCDVHQVYTPSPSDYDCCGTCKNVSCKFHMENGTSVVYAVGSTWHYNCTTYECVKTDEGLIILNYTMVCPPFNETECKMNEGIVKLYNEGCCKICKREERICQKVIIKSVIRKQDCMSQSPINVASCDGKCPSATIYNINIESHLRFCKCCRENGVRNLSVPLYCSGNGTEIMYTLQEPIDCTCQWN